MSAKEQRVVNALKRVKSGIEHVNIGDANTGTYDPTTGSLYKNPAQGLPAGYVWVRRGGSRHAVRARNVGGIAPLDRVNVPVVVGENTRDGGLDVLSINWEKARDLFGDAVMEATAQRHTHVARDIEDGRVYLAASGSLTFRAKPFVYTDASGDRKEWPDNIGSDVTVTNDCASGEHMVVVIALNTATGALATVSGTPASVSTGLTRQDALDVALAGGVLPLAAVHLYDGDTTPRGEDHIWDLRPWFEGSGGAGGAGIVVSDGITDIDPTALLSLDPTFFEISDLSDDTAGMTFIGEAHDLAFTPGDASKWNTPPTHIGGGMDELAGRVADFESVTGGVKLRYVPKLLYDKTLGSAGTFDTNNADDAGRSGIPTTYDHLEFRLAGRAAAAATAAVLFVDFNGDATAANYDFLYIENSGATAVAAATANSRGAAAIPGASSPANSYGMADGYISFYASTTHHKILRVNYTARRTTSDIRTTQSASVWKNTAAINRLQLSCNNATPTFAAGSRLQIWGWGLEAVGAAVAYSAANISNPPTDAELDSAFGIPSVVGEGFVGIVNDAAGGTNEYLCWSDGANWFYTAGTKAT